MGMSALINLRLIVVIGLLLWPLAVLGQEEKSVSMSFIKVAEMEVEKETARGTVKALVHVVKKGEHLWKILRKRGLLQRPDAPALYDLIKDLNRDIHDLNALRPGDKIFLPSGDARVIRSRTEKKEASLEQSIKKEASPARASGEAFEKVRVRPGQSLFGLIASRNKMPASRLHGEYIPRLKEMNPKIKDINHIVPGQILRLPILGDSPAVAAPEAPQAEARTEQPRIDVRETEPGADFSGRLSDSLGGIFSAMGEEWINAGKHFIPLQGGGQIDLDGALFPVLASSTGVTAVVDLSNRLPPRIARLIEASWGNYRVVHLGAVNLVSALDKILSVCGYQRVHRAGEPLRVRAGLDFIVRADFIVVYPPRDDGIREAVIRLCSQDTPVVPGGFAEYLEGSGIRVVDFPKKIVEGSHPGQEAVALKVIAGDPFAIVGDALSIAGKRFSSKAVIPMSRGRKGEFSFSVTADYLVHLKGREAIIDLSGLGSETTDFLKEKGYAVISLKGETDRALILKKVLDFVGVSFKEGKHFFPLLSGGEERNFIVEIEGITFNDAGKHAVIATNTDIPFQIALMLERKGVRVVVISSLN